MKVDITTIDDEVGNSSSLLPEVPGELVYLPVKPDVDPGLVQHKEEGEKSSSNILTRVFRDGQQVGILHRKRTSAAGGEGAELLQESLSNPLSSVAGGSAEKKARVTD